MLLTLDLGLTTGWAIHSRSAELIAYGEFNYLEMENTYNMLFRHYTFTHIVAEMPIIIRGPLGDKLEYTVEQARQIFGPRLHSIDPAQWKSTPWAKSEVPRGTSQHVKDAIRMGRWALKNVVEE